MLRGYGERRVRFLVRRRGRMRFSVRRRLQSALFRETKLQAEICEPPRNPPRSLAGGLLERICPVETFSIVPRSLAGGCPTPPGRRDVTEKRILASGRHGKAHSGHGSSRKGAFYEPRTNQTALFREAPWAVWIVVDLGRRLPGACLLRPKFHLDRALCSERK